MGGDSARVWIAYGRRVVDHVAGSARAVRAGVLERFAELLDQFDDVASAGGPFHWSTDVSPEEVEFLMKGLYELGLVAEAEHEAGRLPLRPAAADDFHQAVVQQVLAAVEIEGPAFAQFVEGLRAEWGVAGTD